MQAIELLKTVLFGTQKASHEHKKKKKRAKKRSDGDIHSSGATTTETDLDDGDGDDDEVLGSPIKRNTVEEEDEEASLLTRKNQLNDPVAETVNEVLIRCERYGYFSVKDKNNCWDKELDCSTAKVTACVLSMFDQGLDYDDPEAVIEQLKKLREVRLRRQALNGAAAGAGANSEVDVSVVGGGDGDDHIDSKTHNRKDKKKQHTAPTTATAPATSYQHPEDTAATISASKQLTSSSSPSSSAEYPPSPPTTTTIAPLPPSQSLSAPSTSTQLTLAARLELVASSASPTDALTALNSWIALTVNHSGPAATSMSASDEQAVLDVIFESRVLDLLIHNILIIFMKINASTAASANDGSTTTSAGDGYFQGYVEAVRTGLSSLLLNALTAALATRTRTKTGGSPKNGLTHTNHTNELLLVSETVVSIVNSFLAFAVDFTRQVESADATAVTCQTVELIAARVSASIRRYRRKLTSLLTDSGATDANTNTAAVRDAKKTLRDIEKKIAEAEKRSAKLLSNKSAHDSSSVGGSGDKSSNSSKDVIGDASYEKMIELRELKRTAAKLSLSISEKNRDNAVSATVSTKDNVPTAGDTESELSHVEGCVDKALLNAVLTDVESHTLSLAACPSNNTATRFDIASETATTASPAIEERLVLEHSACASAITRLEERRRCLMDELAVLDMEIQATMTRQAALEASLESYRNQNSSPRSSAHGQPSPANANKLPRRERVRRIYEHLDSTMKTFEREVSRAGSSAISKSPIGKDVPSPEGVVVGTSSQLVTPTEHEQLTTHLLGSILQDIKVIQMLGPRIRGLQAKHQVVTEESKAYRVLGMTAMAVDMDKSAEKIQAKVKNDMMKLEQVQKDVVEVMRAVSVLLNEKEKSSGSDVGGSANDSVCTPRTFTFLGVEGNFDDVSSSSSSSSSSSEPSLDQAKESLKTALQGLVRLDLPVDADLLTLLGVTYVDLKKSADTVDIVVAQADADASAAVSAVSGVESGLKSIQLEVLTSQPNSKGRANTRAGNSKAPTDGREQQQREQQRERNGNRGNKTDKADKAKVNNGNGGNKPIKSIRSDGNANKNGTSTSSGPRRSVNNTTDTGKATAVAKKQ